MTEKRQYQFLPYDQKKLIQEIGKKTLLDVLKKMLLIRNFEMRAEAAYLQGQVGGFFHSYIGQEAIQTAAVEVIGLENWWITTYRCHALALLLGATPNELMAELYGRSTGNAKGRGGSMHFFTERLLGGFGIVGGHIPIATGAAFSAKYQGKDEVAVCFMGDGAVAQGSFHESLNLASLWDLPCIYVIENNEWGMGTHVDRAIAASPIAEKQAPSYNMKGYTVDGMNFFSCYNAFKTFHEQIKKDSRPILVEIITERFKGHSVSDPGLYRSKEDLKKCMERDPLLMFSQTLIEEKILTPEEYKTMDKEQKEIVMQATQFADKSPWPDPITLEEGVYAPN